MTIPSPHCSSNSLHLALDSRQQVQPFPHNFKCPISKSLSFRHVRRAGSSTMVADAHSAPDSLMTSDDVSGIVQDALSWCALHGLVVGDAQGESSGTAPGLGLVHAPVTLQPSPFPSRAFHRAYSLAPLMNELVDAVSQDRGFLTTTLANAAKSDSFTASLLVIYNKTANEAALKTLRLGLHRSDYMLNMGLSSHGPKQTEDILQVELNTIASSFPGLSSRVTALHRHLLSLGAYQRTPEIAEWSLPPNRAAEGMVEALAMGWRAKENPRAVVLMVVQPGERNLYDQQWLVQELWQRHRVRTIKRTLRKVSEQAELKGDEKDLWIGSHQVSVIYYRAGYGPADYPCNVEWSARLLLERSSALSCPNIAYHLAGAKKVQQKLAEPGVLERFIKNPASAAKLRSCFAGLWSLEASEEDLRDRDGVSKAVGDAMAEPEKFVLKPQREGGGNNIYGQDVKSKLEELLASKDTREGLAAYILMQRIFPPSHKTWMVRKGKATWVESLSELGIYSTYLRSGQTVLLNKAVGHLLRTKTSSSDEGGVASGYAVLDSPYIIE